MSNHYPIIPTLKIKNSSHLLPEKDKNIKINIKISMPIAVLGDKDPKISLLDSNSPKLTTDTSPETKATNKYRLLNKCLKENNMVQHEMIHSEEIIFPVVFKT